MAETFTASDVATLAYYRSGDGPPLVLVHGGATDHRCFDPVLPLLEARYETFAYDRRGAGGNVAGDGYSLDREADDLTEFVAMVGDGRPVPVLAYSYGALISLHTITTRPTFIRALVAYEPPVGLPGIVPEHDEIVRLIDEGRDEDALRLFVGSTFRLSASAVDAMARHPSWQISLEQIAQLRRENNIVVTSRLQAPVGPVPPTRVLVARPAAAPSSARSRRLSRSCCPAPTWPPCPACRTSPSLRSRRRSCGEPSSTSTATD